MHAGGYPSAPLYRDRIVDYRIEVIAQTGVVLLEQELSRVDRKDLIIDRPFPSGYYIVRITNKTTGRQEVVPHIVIRK